MKKLIYILPIIALTFIGCDKVDDPYPELLDDGSTVVIDPALGLTFADLAKINWTINEGTPTTKRNTVIEEFTGAQCKFCPDGSKVLVQLDTVYGEQVIPVSIHAGNFAQFQPDSSKMFFLDLTVPKAVGETEGKGEIYLKKFNPANSYPRGIVSRITDQAESQAKWRGEVDNLKNDPMKATIDLDVWYAESEELIRIVIDYEFLEPSADPHDLQVYLIENHIIGWQDVKGVFTEFYDHKYVLRKVLNGLWGSTAEPAIVGEVYHKEYIIRKAANWDSNNIKAIVFLADRTDKKEIIQANQTSVR
jgi:hypothetical protein